MKTRVLSASFATFALLATIFMLLSYQASASAVPKVLRNADVIRWNNSPQELVTFDVAHSGKVVEGDAQSVWDALVNGKTIRVVSQYFTLDDGFDVYKAFDCERTVQNYYTTDAVTFSCEGAQYNELGKEYTDFFVFTGSLNDSNFGISAGYRTLTEGETLNNFTYQEEGYITLFAR